VALIDRAVRLAMRHGFRRGLLGGSQLWMAVGAVALGVRVMQRLGSRKPVVVTERLAPGQTLVIEHLRLPEG
jgi:hypothetical protein